MVREFMKNQQKTKEACGAPGETSWLDLSFLEAALSLGCPGVGKADAFLSHSQAELALETAILMQSDMVVNERKPTLYFLDYFAIRQCIKGDTTPLLECTEAYIENTTSWMNGQAYTKQGNGILELPRPGTGACTARKKQES